MTEWQTYKRIGFARMRPWVPGMNMEGVSISEADRRNGSPKPGDMIARNPEKETDRWLISEDYFKANFRPIHGNTPEGQKFR